MKTGRKMAMKEIGFFIFILFLSTSIETDPHKLDKDIFRPFRKPYNPKERDLLKHFFHILFLDDNYI